MAVARDLRRRHTRGAAHGLVQPFLVEPVAGQPARAGLDRHGMVGEYIGKQPRGVEPRRLPVGGAGMAGRCVAVRHRVAGAGARREVAQRGQPAVGFRHRECADVVLLRKAAHRRQGRAGAQRAAIHQRGNAGHDLFGQGVAATAAADKVQVEHEALGRARNLYSVLASTPPGRASRRLVQRSGDTPFLPSTQAPARVRGAIRYLYSRG
ncbi:hypothetical protein D3C87_1391930 [compost metagenome]